MARRWPLRKFRHRTTRFFVFFFFPPLTIFNNCCRNNLLKISFSSFFPFPLTFDRSPCSSCSFPVSTDRLKIRVFTLLLTFFSCSFFLPFRYRGPTRFLSMGNTCGTPIPDFVHINGFYILFFINPDPYRPFLLSKPDASARRGWFPPQCISSHPLPLPL